MSVFFSGTPVSSTNKTDHHDTAEILLKVALNTIQTNITSTNTASHRVHSWRIRDVLSMVKEECLTVTNLTSTDTASYRVHSWRIRDVLSMGKEECLTVGDSR